MVAGIIHSGVLTREAEANTNAPANGVYYVRNRQTGHFLNVVNAGNANGTAVDQFSFNPAYTQAQRWEVRNEGGGTFSLAPGCAPSRRLDINPNDEKAQIWANGVTNNQRFQLNSYPNGTHSIQLHGNKVLDAMSQQIGTRPQMYAYLTAYLPWQQWYFIPIQCPISGCSRANTWSPRSTAPANCTQSVRDTWQCDNNHQRVYDSGPQPPGHSQTGAWTTVTAATCDTRGSEQKRCNRAGCSVIVDTRTTPFNYNNHIKWQPWQNEGCTNRRVCGGWDCGASQYSNGVHTFNANHICTRTITTTVTCGSVRNSPNGFRYFFRGTNPDVKISSRYGDRNPPTGGSAAHRGVDFPTDGRGPNVFSIGVGTVKHATFRSYVGNYVAIELTGTGYLNPWPNNNNNLHAAYAHLRTGLSVSVDDMVTANTIIGKSGSSETNREHLCFRILTEAETVMKPRHFIPLDDYSDSINPLQFFSQVEFTHEKFPNDRTWDGTRTQSLGAYRREKNGSNFNFILHP